MPDQAWAERYGAAWSAPDSTALAGFFAPTGRYEDTGTGVSAVGPEAVGRFADLMRRFAPDSEIVFGAVCGGPGSFALEWTWTGSATGPLQLDGVVYPPTGRMFSVDGVAMCAVDADGLLTRHTDIYDMRATLAACGIQEIDPTARALVQRVYPALETGDADTLREVLAPWFRGRLAAGMPAGAGEHVGADAMIEQGWWAIGRAYAVRADPEELIACADGRLLVTGHYAGVSRATGAEVDADFTHLWTAEDGKLIALTQVTDTARWVP